MQQYVPKAFKGARHCAAHDDAVPPTPYHPTNHDLHNNTSYVDTIRTFNDGTLGPQHQNKKKACDDNEKKKVVTPVTKQKRKGTTNSKRRNGTSRTRDRTAEK